MEFRGQEDKEEAYRVPSMNREEVPWSQKNMKRKKIFCLSNLYYWFGGYLHYGKKFLNKKPLLLLYFYYLFAIQGETWSLMYVGSTRYACPKIYFDQDTQFNGVHVSKIMSMRCPPRLHKHFPIMIGREFVTRHRMRPLLWLTIV